MLHGIQRARRPCGYCPSMRHTCSAPKTGHLTDSGEAKCPVHGTRAKRRERLRALQGPPTAAPTGAERSFDLDIKEAVLAEASDSPDEIEAWAGSAGVMVRMAAADNPLAPHRALMT